MERLTDQELLATAACGGQEHTFQLIPVLEVMNFPYEAEGRRLGEPITPLGGAPAVWVLAGSSGWVWGH